MNDEGRHNQENGANSSGGMPLEVLLSVYLDDRESLDGEALVRIETLLANDDEARQTYAELQFVVRELQHLEPVVAPRSYHLDAEMAGAPEPIQLTASSAWYARHAGAVRWATAAAAVIFVFVLSADLMLNSVFTNPADSDDSAMPANQSELNSDRGAVEEAAEEDDETAIGASELAPPAQDEQGDEGAGDDAAGEEASDSVAGDGSDDFEGAAILEAPPDAIPTPAIDEQESEPIADDDTARTDEDLAEEDSAELETYAAEGARQTSENESSDRRSWRIVQFSLAAILGLLISAMVILPRMSGSTRRR